MSDITFEQMWKRLLVYAPELPIPLAQSFINKAYSRALSGYRWSLLRKTSVFLVPDAYDTGTATFTTGSTTVTGVGTTWTSAMVGRQILPENEAPVLDIAAYVSATELTLRDAWLGPTQTVTYSIVLMYLECPSDFLSFVSVIDTTNNWKLVLNVLPESLDMWDAQRTFTGTSWVLAGTRPSADTPPNIRYELWPRTVTEKIFPFMYMSKQALMPTKSDRAVAPLRGDVVIEGALSELALWPGTGAKPNPYFQLGTHREHEQRFIKMVAQCEVEDQELLQTRIHYPDENLFLEAPIDGRFLQRHSFGFWG